MMLAFPINLEPDDNGTFLVTSPDFPELVTFGQDRAEALARALDAVEEAIAARIYDGKDIPRPSEGGAYATLSTQTATKVFLYQGMRDLEVREEEPVHGNVWPLTQLSRAKDLNHRLWLHEWTPRWGPWAVSRQ